jgi:hypothetical protein
MYSVGDSYNISFLNTVGTITNVEQIYFQKENDNVLYQELILSVEYKDNDNNSKVQQILIRNEALRENGRL